MRASPDLMERGVRGPAAEFLQALRVVVLNGPRQAGKTTLMHQLRTVSGGEFRSLDDETHLVAATRDPVGYLDTDARPLFVDEVQRVGDPLVRAVKAAVDGDPRPGRFVLAGSTRFLSEPSLGESLAGRAGIVTVLPFTQGELQGAPESFLDRAFAGPDHGREHRGESLSRDDYLERIVRGGFREPASLPGARARRAWFANYANAVVERDLREMARVNQPSAADSVLRGLAALSGQLLVTSALAEKAGLQRATVERYVGLLEAVFLVHRLQPWSRNPLTRAVRHPKTYCIDSGLHCHLLGADLSSLARPDSPHVGSVIETFVVNELARQATWSETPVRLMHYRSPDGRTEVDTIVESDDGRFLAIEVKAAQSINERDTRHLVALARRHPESFVHGFLFYLGRHMVGLGDGLTALPLSSLWAT